MVLSDLSSFGASFVIQDAWADGSWFFWGGLVFSVSSRGGRHWDLGLILVRKKGWQASKGSKTSKQGSLPGIRVIF
jgi:hypothetical protein